MSTIANNTRCRIFIYPKDLERIASCKNRTARRIMHKICNVLGKPPGYHITIHELCVYLDMKEEEIRAYLVD